jgi:hypothetical protein
MIIITSVSDTVFEMNGIRYLKNYVSRPFGNKIEIYNCYERGDVLVTQTGYQNFNVDSQTFGNATELQEALLSVLFNRNSLNSTTFPDATPTAKGKIQLSGDLGGTAAQPTVPGLNSKLPIETGAAIGTAVTFTIDRIYGTVAVPVTGNITADVTGARFGVTNMMIHKSQTSPVFDAKFKKLNGSQDYMVGTNNYIYMVYLDATHINYSIQQIQ